MMAVRVFLLLAVLARATGQQQYELTWNCQWMAANFANYTINARLGDTIIFRCSAGPAGDRYENLFRLHEQSELDTCAGASSANFLEACFVGDIPVTLIEGQGAGSAIAFQPGRTYYFTSFSDGSTSSAQNESGRSGGSCAKNPPLGLTVNIAAAAVVPTTSSAVMPTASTPVTSTSNTVVMPTQGGIGGTGGGAALLVHPWSCTVLLILSIVGYLIC